MIASNCAGRVRLPGSPGSCFFSFGVHDGDQVLRRDSTRESAVLGKYEDETGRRSIRTVGSPMDVWHIPDGERVAVQFNHSHQPIGHGGVKFNRIAGKIVRNGRFVPLHGNWKTPPNAGKDEMWCALMKKFYVEPVDASEDIKRVTLMDLGNKRRHLRCDIKKKVELISDDNVQSVVDRARDKGIIFDAEDFEILVDRWLTKDDKDIEDKARTSHGLNKYLHTLGSKSITQVADEMSEDMGETLNQNDMWVVTHTKKDGNPVTKEAGEAIAQIKAIIERQELAE